MVDVGGRIQVSADDVDLGETVVENLSALLSE